MIQTNFGVKIIVFGAIGNCLTEPVYTLLHGTQSENYIRFIHEVVAKLRPSQEKPILLFDGLRSHTSRISMAVVNRYFRPLKNVPYSCQFNAIESVWGVAKNNFVKLAMLQDHWYSDEEFYSLVRRSLQMISRGTMAGLLRSNHAYLRKLLQLGQ